jgi:hypothetical protein
MTLAETELFVVPEREADRFFDPWRIPYSEGAKALVTKVINTVQGYESYYSKRQRKRRARDQETLEVTVSAVICDLLCAVLMRDERGTAISRSNQVLGKNDRYHAPALNRQLPHVLDVLATPELDWLRQERGYENPFGRNQLTTIKPSERLRNNMCEYGIELGDIRRCKTEEPIILKAEKEDYWDKGAYLPYDETAQTRRYRAEMLTINSWLADGSIELDETALEWDRIVDTGNRTLRRYFSQGSFESGGRLFGGFWQGLSKNERLNGITINDEDVVGLDYGQIAPRILYDLADAQPPEGDIYEIPGLTTLNGKSYRDGVKKVMNALTFTEGLPHRKPMGTKHILPPTLSIQQIVSLIKQAHPAIAHLLGSDIGHRVQFIESQVMVKVLLTLREQCIVALPIHDGLVVPSEAETTAKTVMMDVFRDEVGTECPVSVELRQDYTSVFDPSVLLGGYRNRECSTYPL